MAQPPPPAGPTGRPGAVGARPPLLTAAGIVLIVIGGLQALFGLLAIVGGGAIAEAGGGGLGGIVIIYGILTILVGAAGIYAGVQVLALRARGRSIALVVAAVGAVLSLLGLIQGDFVFSLLFLIAYGFVIWAVYTNSREFTR